MEVCKDMGSFSFVLLLAMVAWGNAYYILAVNAFNIQTAGLSPTEIEEQGIVYFANG
jgi:hypothetical protein